MSRPDTFFSLGVGVLSGNILVVAEKPSVGRDLARVLGCKQKKEGFIAGEKYIVTWAIGHLVSLSEPEDYDPSYKKWSLKTLPIIPAEMKLKEVKGVKKQFKVVKMLMNSTEISSIICATDAGREGELIFRYIYRLSECEKPFYRLWVSSMLDAALMEGFRHLKPGSDFDHLFESARCRSEADWLVGINATRAYTVRQGGLLSVGRVQTPTLAILVKRQEEIDNFVPRDYWEIRADYGDFQGLWYNPESRESRIYEQEKAKEIAARVTGQKGYITNIKKENKKELPPQLYDLNELQRDANKKFGFSAQKTLAKAQDLYEKYKVITYPRTDSRYLTADMVGGLSNLIKKVAVNNEKLSKYVDYLLGLSKLPITKRLVDDKKVTDHHAIIPTGKKAKLPPEAQKIFDLVVFRLLAVFYPEYKYQLTTVTVEVKDEQFLSRGKVIQQEGWKEIYREAFESERNKGAEDLNMEEKEQLLPPLSRGDEVQVKDTEIKQKQTRPPAQYTESALLGAMENAGRFVEDEELKEHLKERGLGTPATRAGIIERLIKVGYLERQGKKLVPTQKGINLIQVVPPELKSPEMTGEWEQELYQISRGQLEPEKFMENIKKYTRYLVDEAARAEINPLLRRKNMPASGGESKNNGEILAPCPACKEGKVIANSKGYECSRRGEGCVFFIGATILGKKLPLRQVKQLLQNGKTELLEGFTSKKGKKFNARLILSEDGQLKFQFT